MCHTRLIEAPPTPIKLATNHVQVHATHMSIRLLTGLMLKSSLCRHKCQEETDYHQVATVMEHTKSTAADIMCADIGNMAAKK